MHLPSAVPMMLLKDEAQAAIAGRVFGGRTPMWWLPEQKVSPAAEVFGRHPPQIPEVLAGANITATRNARGVVIAAPVEDLIAGILPYLRHGPAIPEVRAGAGVTITLDARGYVIASAPTIVRTSSDQAINGIALANVTGMSFSVAASTDYFFEFFVLYRSADNLVGLGLAVTCPASPNEFAYNAEIVNLADSGGGDWQGQGTATADPIIAPNTPAINTTYLARLQGIIRNGGTAGTIQLQAQNETATNNITIKNGSVLRWQQI